MKKSVPMLAAFKWGFSELAGHLGLLLPLSALFFAPDLCEKAGLAWPGWLSKIFQTAFFFVLLLRAMKLTQPKGEAPPQGRPKAFAIGEAVKWLAQGTAFTLGLLGLGLYLSWRSPETLALLGQGGLGARGEALLSWWKAEPWWSEGAAALVLGCLPLWVHVTLNFFGYIVADQGLDALAALKESARLVQGAQARLWAFYAVCVALNYLGFRLWIVGAIYTFPATVLATVYVYRALAAR